jgi:hypothetical protein
MWSLPFANQDFGKESRTRHRTVDDSHRGRADDDSGLAALAGVLATLRDLDSKSAGLPLQYLAVLGSHRLLLFATFRAAQLLRRGLTDQMCARASERADDRCAACAHGVGETVAQRAAQWRPERSADWLGESASASSKGGWTAPSASWSCAEDNRSLLRE